MITKAVCAPPTVKDDAAGNYTVTRTATYSDGNVVKGWANLLPSQNKITFEPEDVSGGQ